MTQAGISSRRAFAGSRRWGAAGACAAGVALVITVAGCGSDSSGGGGASSSSAGGGGSSGAGSSSAGQSVSIKGFAFAPAALTVKPGTQVTFTNQDTAVHTATADDKSFDSKNLDQGKTFSYTFATAGTFTYHCTIHSYMTAKVTVAG